MPGAWSFTMERIITFWMEMFSKALVAVVPIIEQSSIPMHLPRLKITITSFATTLLTTVVTAFTGMEAGVRTDRDSRY